MAKGLIVSLPLHGHMAPLLPLVRELAAVGDELVVYSSPPFADRIDQAGARFRPYGAGSLDGLTGLQDKTEQLSSLLMSLVGQVLAADLSDMRHERPDYIVTDSLAPWGQWIAQILRVPVVTSISTFAVNRHVAAFAASHGVRPKSVALIVSKLRHVSKALLQRRQLSRRYGVPGLGVFDTVFGHSALNIVHTSREFQPCSQTFDASFHFVGAAALPAAGGDGEVTGGGAPVVYISLGTLFNADVTFYRHCFEAFRAEPVQVVMAIGTHVAVSELGAVPTNVTVAPFVAQVDVLRGASAFVTHGGMNSVSESLRLGVPMVTVPQMGEQEMVSRRVEQVGAGLYLAKHDVSPDALRRAVRRLLDEPRFRTQAAIMGETLRAAGGPSMAAQLVRSLIPPQTSIAARPLQAAGAD